MITRFAINNTLKTFQKDFKICYDSKNVNTVLKDNEFDDFTIRIVYVENQREIGAYLSYLGYAMNAAVSFPFHLYCVSCNTSNTKDCV